MTQAQVLDEVRRWTPQDKWALVEVLLRDLRTRGSDAGLPTGMQADSSVVVRRHMTALGEVPTLSAAVVANASGLFDLGGDAVKDGDALYD
jgi:hypothetical protein